MKLTLVIDIPHWHHAQKVWDFAGKLRDDVQGKVWQELSGGVERVIVDARSTRDSEERDA